MGFCGGLWNSNLIIHGSMCPWVLHRNPHAAWNRHQFGNLMLSLQHLLLSAFLTWESEKKTFICLIKTLHDK